MRAETARGRRLSNRVGAVAALGLAVVGLAACGSSAASGPSLVGATSALAADAPSTSVRSAASTLKPKGQVDTGVPVVRVVDGDTLHVLLRGQEVTVRMIGMNTPETVKENTPVECYGPEASDYAKHTLTGQTVTLEYDDSQGREDQYGRTLAYIWRERQGGGLDFVNLDEVAKGYARERQYGPVPYAWKDTFRAAQKSAKSTRAGLWGACPT